MSSVPIDKTSVRRLLVRSTNWIGDAVMTTPALRALRAGFPQAHITLLVKPWVTPVFVDSPRIDTLMTYADPGRHRGLTGTMRLTRDLRGQGFDAAVLLQNAFEAAFLAAAARIPIRAGYRTDGRHLLLTHGVTRTAAVTRVHQTHYYLGLMEALGLPARGSRTEIFLGADARRRAARMLSRSGLDLQRPIVGVNPSATFGSAKQWPPDRFARLADRLRERFDAQILLFGGPSDRRLGATVAAAMRSAATDFSGRSSLAEAMALIDRCSLFVTNDSGLMHVAAALDVPVVAVFGSTDPVTTGPGGRWSRVVRVPLPCSPCLKPVCPIDHRCMRDVTVEMMYRAAVELLQEAEAGRPSTTREGRGA